MAKRKPTSSERLRRCRKKTEKPNSVDDAQNNRLILHGLTPNPVASKFIGIVPDHLLVEIFLRLPDGRRVLQAATVCKRWRSLIEKLGSEVFNQYHIAKQSRDSSYFPSTTSVFLFYYAKRSFEPSYQILCTDQGTPSRPKLFSSDFCLTVRAVCFDSLLLSCDIKTYLIHNPQTRKQIALPEIDQPFNVSGYGLVLQPTRYKVVLISKSCFRTDQYMCFFSMFNSESGLWTPHVLGVPYTARTGTPCFADALFKVVLTRDGVLHWLVLRQSLEVRNPYNNFACVLSFDPFSFKHDLVPIPESSVNSGVSAPDKLQLGVVRGQLWLWRLMKIDEKSGYVLRAWELDSAAGSSTSWRLVHDVVLHKSSRDVVVRVLDFDPIDGNVVYLVRGGGVYRYEIGVGKYDKVRGLPYCENATENMKRHKLKGLRVVTLTHSLWPQGYQSPLVDPIQELEAVEPELGVVERRLRKRKRPQ